MSEVLGGERVEVGDVSSVKRALVLILNQAEEGLLSRVHFHCLDYHIIIERIGFVT